MPEFCCSRCQAELAADLIESTGRVECPFCGADVSALGLPEATAPLEPGEPADDLAPPAGDPSPRVLPGLPEASQIRVIESSPDRIVFFIPAGGKQTAAIGCFALMWNVFMCVFTPPWFLARVQPGNRGGLPDWGLIAFLAVFWAVGLGMAWFWLKLRFERTFVLLDRERVVVQKLLFGRKRSRETPLGPDSRSELVESYQQNDVPVYRVEVAGPGGAVSFGTALSNDEKDWLVDRINEFLGSGRARQRPDDLEDGNSPAATEAAIGALAATGSPAAGDSILKVVESSPKRLELVYAVAPHSPIRWVVPLFLVPFSAIWLGFFGFVIWRQLAGPFHLAMVFHVLFNLPFIIVGVGILLVAAFARWGRTTIELTRQRLACRWSLGPFGFTRTLPARDLTSVRVEYDRISDARTRKRRIRDTGGKPMRCVARAGPRSVHLTFFNDELLARRIEALVGSKLAEWGQPLAGA